MRLQKRLGLSHKHKQMRNRTDMRYLYQSFLSTVWWIILHLISTYLLYSTGQLLTRIYDNLEGSHGDLEGSHGDPRWKESKDDRTFTSIQRTLLLLRYCFLINSRRSILNYVRSSYEIRKNCRPQCSQDTLKRSSYTVHGELETR